MIQFLPPQVANLEVNNPGRRCRMNDALGEINVLGNDDEGVLGGILP
jgi:hypothetical protein